MFVQFDPGMEQIIRLKENVKPGDLIYTVEAVDPDPGEFGKLVYSLVSGNELQLFSLNATSGGFRLARQLPLYFTESRLTVRVVDSSPTMPKSSKCQLRILGPKAFAHGVAHSLIEFTVDRGVGPMPAMLPTPLPIPGMAQPWGWFEPDDGAQQSEECGRLLAVHFGTGQLTVPSFFPDDSLSSPISINCSFAFVQGTAAGNAPQPIDKFRVLLKILPLDWNVLRLENEHFFGNVDENAALASPVLSSSSSALSGPLPLQIRLSIRSNDVFPEDGIQIPPKAQFRMLSPLDTHFTIDSLSGIVRSLAPLDFEEHPNWEFAVLAQQQQSIFSPPKYSQPSWVRIAVNNLDDQAPKFAEANLQHFQLILPTIQGALLGTVHAEDGDLSSSSSGFSPLRYSLGPSRMTNNLFSLDQHNGQLRTLARGTDLANFGSQHSLQFTVFASDGLHSATELPIQVKLVNGSSISSPLHFGRSFYKLSLREGPIAPSAVTTNNSDLILLLSLWPANVQLGQHLHFKLISPPAVIWSSAFELDPRVGLLWLNPAAGITLDRESPEQQQMEMAVHVTDGKDVSQCVVQIELEDVNDNAPEFLQSEYSASISEAAKAGDRLLQVRAKDVDAGLNAAVRYSLAEDAPDFVELNKYDGKLTVGNGMEGRALARGHILRFHVNASDRGVPFLCSSAAVQLEVVHRHQPVFSHSIYSATLDQHQQTGVADLLEGKLPLLTVRAWSGGQGAQIGYLLMGTDSQRRPFRLDFDRGQLFIAGPLAQEQDREYLMDVQARDITRPEAPIGTARIRIDRLWPGKLAFVRSTFKWSAPENMPVGTVVGHLELANSGGNRSMKFARLVSRKEGKPELSPLSVDQLTGNVLLTSSLDFERCQRHEMVVEASGKGEAKNGETTRALVQLEVTDVNDNWPQFVGIGHNKELEILLAFPEGRENSSEFQFLHKFRAIDADTEFNWPDRTQQLRFGINEPNAPAFLRLEPRTGVFYANWTTTGANSELQLNYSNIRLNISVSDGLHRAFAGITLRPVAQLAENNLQFQQNQYSARVAENSPTGTPIGLVQARGGTPPYSFGSVEGGPWPIGLESDSGRVMLRTTGGERANWSGLPIPLMARDADGRRAFAQFRLEPAQDNEHTPRWIAPATGYQLSFDLWTDHSDNPTVLQVFAVDEDRADRLEYQIIGNALDGLPFRLNSSSGLLSFRPSSPWSPASPSPLSFSVRVSDSANPPHQSQVSVHIRLLSAHSNQPPPPFGRVPQFVQPKYLFAVPEDAPIGYRLGRLRIANEDGFAGKLRFSILESDYSKPFKLDEGTAELTLGTQLDAESHLAHHFVVEVSREAEQNGQRVDWSSLAIVSVAVMGVNDQAPKFIGQHEGEGAVQLELRENEQPGAVVAAFVAVDGDREGETAEMVSYSLEDGDRGGQQPVDWAIDPEMGWLLVGPGGLDRERRSQYHLGVVATDAVGHRAVQRVHVRILDLNDSPPQFDNKTYKLTLEFDAKGKMVDKNEGSHRDEVMQFRVTDQDQGQPEPSLILLDNPLEMFHVNKQTLLLARFPTPRELPERRMFIVRLAAFDGLLSSIAQLELELVPNWPFEQGIEQGECGMKQSESEMATEIGGDLPIGHSVYAYWGKRSLALLNSADMEGQFEIVLGHQNNKSLVTLGHYQHRQSHSIELLVGEEEEDSRSGQNGDCLAQFSCIRRLEFKVAGANRHSPEFPSPKLTVNVSEDAFEVGQMERGQVRVLTRLEAVDQDIGNFGHLHYSIASVRPSPVEGNADANVSPFRLDPDSGVLALGGPLDRERVEQFVLDITATDGGGLSGRVQLTVNVLDVNDNAPECGRPLYQAQLLENEPGALELQLEATDRDREQQFQFTLAEQTPRELARLIRVSPSGLVTLAPDSSLDFEHWAKKAGGEHIGAGGKGNGMGPAALIQFDVEVEDRGTPVAGAQSPEFVQPQKGRCHVQLALLDVNDNQPLFQRQLYEAVVDENAPEGTKVIQVKAEDADSEHFGRLSYSIVSARLNGGGATDGDEGKDPADLPPTIGPLLPDLDAHFQIGAEDGWVTVAKPLDHELLGNGEIGKKPMQIRLRVRAMDGGEPPLSGETEVSVRILDRNDNSPAIVDCGKLSALAQEDIPPGHPLLTFAVTDADSAQGNAGPFRLELSGDGAEMFSVDSKMNLVASGPLQFAQRREFHLEVRALDSGGLASPVCPLRVQVQPQSRHAPDVLPLSIRLMALHGEFLGGSLGRLHARDRDPTDSLRFSISSAEGDQQHRFSVHPETGELFAKADLLSGLHRFNVSVTDGKFVSVAPVSVDVFPVDRTQLDHSLSIRLRGVGAQRFVRVFMRRFGELLARLVGVRPENVRILSLQQITQQSQQHSADTKTVAATWRRRRRQTGGQPRLESKQNKGNGANGSQSDADTKTSTAANPAQMEEPNALLDVLLAVQRPDGAPPGAAYFQAKFVKQRLENGMSQLFAREMPGLSVLSLTTEICRRDSCARGDCRDRLWLDNARMNVFGSSGPGSALVFLGPAHLRTLECICRQGYAGPHCDVPVNRCSKELCRRAELCIPAPVSSPSATQPAPGLGLGFSCSCPPGFRGPACTEPVCPLERGRTEEGEEQKQCQRQQETISLLGQGYIELHIAGGTGPAAAAIVGGANAANSLESRMELTLDFRTVSADAVLMFGRGLRDWHTLRLEGGRAMYQWDCGTGIGSVRLSGQRLDDGQWHRLRVLRIGRLGRLTLDEDKAETEGTSPPGADVLNLFGQANVLTLGAKVEYALQRWMDSKLLNGTGTWHNTISRSKWTADELTNQVTQGMVGCIGRVDLDGVELTKSGPGLRLFNAGVGCDERTIGPCLSGPCQNGGQCMPEGDKREEGEDQQQQKKGFSCNCPPRYTGARCEIDLNACASHPCPNGIPCHNLYGDFHCSCPAGFTGKRCQLRGDWDPCVTAQCGPNGQCVRQGQSFVCQCATEWTGPFCTERGRTKTGTADTEGEDAHGGEDHNGSGEDGQRQSWLTELLRSNGPFFLLALICGLSLPLTLLAIFVCRRRPSASRNRRSKKVNAQETTLSGTFTKAGVGSGGRRERERREKGRRESSPLVPRQVPAPATADRLPPPLPPRYHKRDANGNSTALPTIEVRPMPVARPTSSNGSLKGTVQAGGSKKHPMPPPRVSSASEDGAEMDPLRAFGIPLGPVEEMNGLTEDADRNTTTASGNDQTTNDQMQQQPTVGTRAEAGSFGRKIDQACTAAANTQRQRAKPLSLKPKIGEGKPSGSDYLTMKPVHRAKPFLAKGRHQQKAVAGENPPPPPRHRTPLLGAKLYDSPVDDGVEEDEAVQPKAGGN